MSPHDSIAQTTDLAVVPAHLDPTTAPARRFFERRRSVITRAFGSPKIPRTVGCARKPANEYVSHSRRRRLDARAIRNSCQISHPSKCLINSAIPAFLALSPQKSPTPFHEDPDLLMWNRNSANDLYVASFSAQHGSGIKQANPLRKRRTKSAPREMNSAFSPIFPTSQRAPLRIAPPITSMVSTFQSRPYRFVVAAFNLRSTLNLSPIY